MPKMPLRLQEAAVAANETNLNWCREHGVEESVIDKYQQLRRELLQSRQTGNKVPNALIQNRYTYWYYLLVTSPNMAKMREEIARRTQQQKADEANVSAH